MNTAMTPTGFPARVLEAPVTVKYCPTWGREYLLNLGSSDWDDSEEPLKKFTELLEGVTVLPEIQRLEELEKVEGPMQMPLITQMRKFKIQTPNGHELLMKDPRYQKRIQALADILVEAMR